MVSKAVVAELGARDREPALDLSIAHEFAAVRWVESLDELRSWWDLGSRHLDRFPPEHERR